MNRFAALLILLCLLFTSARAELLGKEVEITAPANWESVAPLPPGQPALPYPVLKYVPKDGRNAAVLLKLLPADVPGYEVTDLVSLWGFHLVESQPYLSGPDARPALNQLKVPGGLGVYLTTEDPALIGKPVPPGEFRIATTVSLLLGGKTLLHCTIFHDEKDSIDLKEALKIVLSAATHAPSQTI